MVSPTHRYVVDNEGRPLQVILDIADYEAMVEQIEELEDIRAFKEAKAEVEEEVPFQQAKDEIERGEA